MAIGLKITGGMRLPERTQRAYSLKEMAERLGVPYKGEGNIVIRGVAPLEVAGPDELSFLSNNRYVRLLKTSRAAAVIVDPAHQDCGRPVLVSDQPYVTMARAGQLFAPKPAVEPGVHTSAWVADDVRLGAASSVGPLAQVGSGSRIGDHSHIGGGCYLGREVMVGDGCLIHPNVTILDRCSIGDRVTIHSGTVIGSDGFGFAQDRQGRHVKIPQRGTVQIDDDVEIGANCAVDRATFGRTWIQKGCIIDNLVQIAHNVTVGEYSILVAQVGIAGSTRLGRHVVLGGQVGVAGHLELADGVRVGAKSGVPHSITEAQDMLGSPAVNARQWLRTYGSLKRLPRIQTDLRDLKRRLEELEKALVERESHSAEKN